MRGAPTRKGFVKKKLADRRRTIPANCNPLISNVLQNDP